MPTLKIGIVEDDLIIAEAVSEMLTESGYTVTEPATRYSEAIAMIEDESPDLILIDINILGRMDGIEVARTVRKTFDIPFIFLTANTDFNTIARAKEVMPSAYLAKPITKAQLFAAIEIAAASWNTMQPEKPDPSKAPVDIHLFVKDGYSFRRVECGEIIYAESDLNYVRLHLADGTTPIVRSTLAELEERTVGYGLLRVHRSYMVQLARVEKVLPAEVIAGGHHVPVSRAYRDALIAGLNIG